MIKNTIRAVAVAIAHPAVADAIHRSNILFGDGLKIYFVKL